MTHVDRCGRSLGAVIHSGAIHYLLCGEGEDGSRLLGGKVTRAVRSFQSDALKGFSLFPPYSKGKPLKYGSEVVFRPVAPFSLRLEERFSRNR